MAKVRPYKVDLPEILPERGASEYIGEQRQYALRVTNRHLCVLARSERQAFARALCLENNGRVFYNKFETPEIYVRKATWEEFNQSKSKTRNSQNPDKKVYVRKKYPAGEQLDMFPAYEGSKFTGCGCAG